MKNDNLRKNHSKLDLELTQQYDEAVQGVSLLDELNQNDNLNSNPTNNQSSDDLIQNYWSIYLVDFMSQKTL